MQSNQMVILSLFLFVCLFFPLPLFCCAAKAVVWTRLFFVQISPEKKRREIRWCCVGWEKKASRKLSVISHVTNWIASNRKSLWRSLPTRLCLVKQQVADKQGKIWKVRKPLAVNRVWTSNTWHHFISSGRRCLKQEPYACTSKSIRVFCKYHVAV